MKILHTADWHIGQFKGPVVDGVNLRSQDTVKCLEYMVQVAIEEKPDIVCVSGDIFHQEQVGPVRYSDEMITATNIITSLAHFSKYVIVMRGTPNHDGAAQFRVLERMLLNIRNVDVVTEPGVIKTPWADIACLPGFDKQEFRAKFPGLSADEENLAWTKYISDMVFALRAECEKTPILMAHYTVPGCNMESGQTSFFTNFEPVIPREALMAARYEAVLLGHIHRPQIIEGFDNVFYSGAINAMNFNDEGQERGFWVHEFNENGVLVKGHRYTTPYRQFQTITWDPDEAGDYIREGAMYLHRTGISEDLMIRKMRPRSRAVKKSEESQRVLDALDAYLEGNIDEPVRWLVRFWQDQAAVMLYRELREIVIGETDPESLFDIWFQDYSKMLSERMTPVWEQAFLEGWKNNSLFCGAEDVISSESWVRSWIVDHTGDLITNCCNEQVSAIRYLIAEAESLNMSSAETARYIRPTIGLTERQAAANLKYYNSIKERLTTDHPRMKPESIERKAREAASKYAERQQRYRAETIARSEIAQAYNHGADAFVREAVTAGNLPEMEKEWSTALDGHVCASCAALEGAKIGMDDEFKTVSGRREITTSIPPLHPRCKCAVKYVRVKNENIQ